MYEKIKPVKCVFNSRIRSSLKNGDILSDNPYHFVQTILRDGGESDGSPRVMFRC